MSAIPLDFPADRITDDLIERRHYARDLAPVPGILVKPFFKALPDGIVRPGNVEQVAHLMQQATRLHFPVTPRAAGSTSYYNSVPVRGGIVLDVNDLRDGIDLDPMHHTVRVLPATTWFQLDDALQQQGFATKSYPSSAVSATIGGWVNTQGHGIGSLQYGSLGEQLISLQVVLPDGQVRTITRETNPPLEWFVASEGTLGIVTQVELSVRPRPIAEAHHLFAFGDLSSLGQSIQTLARAEPRPYTIFFADDGYLELLQRGGFHVPFKPTSDARSLLLVSFQGESSQIEGGKDLLLRLSGHELSADLAIEEWSLRLFHLRTKRVGPSLLAAEMWLPLNNLAPYLHDVATFAARRHQIMGNYGLVVAPDQVQITSIYPADERHTFAYLAAIGFTKQLYDLGARYGGRPYGVGLWNTAYLSRLFSREKLAELRRRKAQLDPDNIMNPGKLYAAPFPLWPITFGPGASALGIAHTLHRRKM